MGAAPCAVAREDLSNGGHECASKLQASKPLPIRPSAAPPSPAACPSRLREVMLPLMSVGGAALQARLAEPSCRERLRETGITVTFHADD